jgi:hypothetical protein
MAPTERSILPQFVSLTAAFPQQTDIGWLALPWGHIASGWSTAYTLNYVPRKGKKPPLSDTINRLSRQWCHRVIPLLWQFSKSIWAQRNAVVHGQTSLAPSKEILQMRASVRTHFQTFQEDPHCVPGSHSHLFNRGLDRTLNLRRDTMACWLHSVDEAIATQLHRQQHSTRKITTYFPPRPRCPPKVGSPASLWHPPFSASYYVQKPPTTKSRKHRPRSGPLYRHPAYQRCSSHPPKANTSAFPRPPSHSGLLSGTNTSSAIRPLRSTKHLKAIQSGNSHVPRSAPKRRTKHRKPSPARLTLTQLGFTIRQRPQAPLPLRLSRRQLDQESQRTDYSGTYVSSTP